MKPATALPWTLGEYSDIAGHDCMTGGMKAGPAALDGSDYGQRACQAINAETLAALTADAAYIVHACNHYPELVAALRALVKAEEDYGDASNAAINEAWEPARALLAKLGEQ